MYPLKNSVQDLLRLFYPLLCPVCGNDLMTSASVICSDCTTTLPHTRFENFMDNPTEKIFTGRLDVNAAHSEFYFSKGKAIQKLIHQLKYEKKKNVGLMLGEITAKSIQSSGRFEELDFIIPLPMNRNKEIKRGYNQAEVIAIGMSSVLNIPVVNNVVIKEKNNESQTKKHRAARWANVDGSFVLKDPQTLYRKKILLVDDVITTGATIDACGQCLKSASEVSIYVATVAKA